ncbi:polyamine-transporting ATPase 13A2 [Nilaparvata lugens]|uniref:polyamine-transporting ATPase 13A2 n=1 Tax=Nilaparvata lugens TaxID=108931 RepID=UPI00193DDC82|nr:polyamine-transporting ATPase 13A2 [Nilaparvata lugens]
MDFWRGCRSKPTSHCKPTSKGFRLGGYEGIACQIHQIIENEDGEGINLKCNSYKQSKLQKICFYFVCILFFGVPLLLFRWYPPLEVYVFWQKCFLDDAEIVLIKESGMKAAKRKISTVMFDDEDQPLRFFSYKLQKFVWCHVSRQFKLLRGLADGVTTLSNLIAAPDGISHQEREKRLKIYDSNVVHIKVEPFWQLWLKHALYPFIVFEVLSVILWIFDEYSVYAAFVIIYSIIAVTLSSKQERTKKLRLHKMVSASKMASKITVLHNKEEYECDIDDLVPGDVIKIPPRGFPMPCDAILLSGSCIVTESELTGESAPVLKTSPVVSPDSREIYSPSSVHMRHTLFCGTQIIQTRYYGDNEMMLFHLSEKSGLVSDIPQPENVTVATFADDTAVLSVGETVEVSTEKLQVPVNRINVWTKHWLIKLNEAKSVQVNFTNRRVQYIPLMYPLNGNIVPYSNTAKYLGMTLDAKLRWKEHVKKKREQLGIKFKKMYWLLGRTSKLSNYNKLLLYKQILKPVWTYGIQLWGCIRPSNIDIIQRFQNKVLRSCVDAPWYIRNSDLHRDLGVATVISEIQRFAEKHEKRLHQHVNVEAIQLLNVHGSSFETLFLRTMDIVTITVPPTLPGAMLAVSMHSLSRLKKFKIFCSSHPRIVVAGKTKLVCFDKTGTLTEEGLDLWGVLQCKGVENLSEDDVIKDVTTLEKTSKLLASLATCHSLTIIDDKICGDPLDTSMFIATKWELEEAAEDTHKFDLLSPTVVRPKRGVQETPSKPCTDYCDETSFCYEEIPYEIGIIKKFAFTSTTQNMTVICRILGAPNMTAFSKGAPEKILGLCNRESLPENIMEILEHYTSSGFRVIALAYKELPRKFNWKKAQRTSREEIETDMNLLGIMLMQNFLKENSGPVIKELNEAGMKCIMATGDNILTAVSVSQECGILPKHCTVATLQFDDKKEIVLESLKSTQSKRRQFDLGNESLYLAIDGNNWSLLRTHCPHYVDIILLKCVVFARMSPLHKTQLITAYQSLGYIVTMCGDGANDCGALKAAHVGISLTNAEASIAAPFTVSEPSITGVVRIIKEGRCALVTSFILFKFMAMYSMVQFFSVMILYSRGTEMGTNQFLYIDLPVTWSLALAMGHLEPAENLSPKLPISKILSASNIIPLVLQVFTAFFIQWLSLNSLKTQEWYTPVTPAVADEEIVLSWENSVVYGVSCFQYVLLAFVYSYNDSHQKSMSKNWTLLICFFVMLAFNISLLVIPCKFLSELFEMQPWTEQDAFFRLALLGFPVFHLAIALFIEVNVTYWIENSYFVKRKNMYRYQYIDAKLKSGTPWQLIEV